MYNPYKDDLCMCFSDDTCTCGKPKITTEDIILVDPKTHIIVPKTQINEYITILKSINNLATSIEYNISNKLSIANNTNIIKHCCEILYQKLLDLIKE